MKHREAEHDPTKAAEGRVDGVPGFDNASVCPACGTAARREEANYCLVCGKLLDEGYEPLDVLRASYGLQGKGLETPAIASGEKLFGGSKNSAAETAWACVVYSMVPYLGVLFVPAAIFTGGFAYIASYRKPSPGGRSLAAASIGISFIILAVQIILWWLLYIIPELAEGV